MSRNTSESPGPMTAMPSDVIRNPNEKRHYMGIKQFPGAIKIWQDDKLIADSDSALLVQEVGNRVYDPVYYLPPGDILVALYNVSGKSTHCPLKGDASYFSVSGLHIGDNQYFAWSYENPFDFAFELAGHYAFNQDFVRIELVGNKALKNAPTS